MNKNTFFQILAVLAVISFCRTSLADDTLIRRGVRQASNPRLREKPATVEERLLKDGSLSISVEASSSSHSSAEANGESVSASSHDGREESSSSTDSRSSKKSATRNRTESKAKAKADAKAQSQVGVKIQLGKPLANSEDLPPTANRATAFPRSKLTDETALPGPKVKSRRVTILEADRKIEITVSRPMNIEFQITPLSESGNVAGDSKSYVAKSVQQLRTERKDLYELFEEYFHSSKESDVESP